METIIGFVAGYLAGTRDGREGMERLRRSIETIRTSPEVRKLAAEALAAAEALTRRTNARGPRQASAVTDMVVRAAGALGRDRSRAA